MIIFKPDFVKTFCTSLDILSDEAVVLRQRFQAFIRHFTHRMTLGILSDDTGASLRDFQNSSDMSDMTDRFRDACLKRGNWSIKGRKSHKMELIYSLALEEEGSLRKPDVPCVQIIR